MAEDATKRLLTGERMVQALLQTRLTERTLLLEASAEELQSAEASRQKWLAVLHDELADLRDGAAEDAILRLEQLRLAYEAFATLHEQVVTTARTASTPEASRQAQQLSAAAGRAAFDRVQAALREWISLTSDARELAGLNADASTTWTLLINQCLQALVALQRLEKNLLLASTVAEMEHYSAHILATDGKLQEKLLWLSETAPAQGKPIVDSFKTAYAAWLAHNETVRALTRENSNAVAKSLSTIDGRQAFEAAVAAMQTIVASAEQDMLADKAYSHTAYTTTRTRMLVLLAASILLGGLIALWVSVGIHQGLQHVMRERGVWRWGTLISALTIAPGMKWAP